MTQSASFGSSGRDEHESFYHFDEGFGKAGIYHGEKYYDKWEGVNRCPEIAKAHMDDMMTKAPSIGNETGGTVTVYGLMPSFVDPSIVDRTVRATPLVALLPRRAVRGRSYVFNALTVKAGAAFLDDDAALADQVDTYVAVSTQM